MSEVELYGKCVKVISSCKTIEQYAVATRYLSLARRRLSVEFHEALRAIKDCKKQEIWSELYKSID